MLRRSIALSVKVRGLTAVAQGHGNAITSFVVQPAHGVPSRRTMAGLISMFGATANLMRYEA